MKRNKSTTTLVRKYEQQTIKVKNKHYKKRGFRPRLKNAAIDPKNAAIGYSCVFYSRIYKRDLNTAAIVL